MDNITPQFAGQFHWRFGFSCMQTFIQYLYDQPDGSNPHPAQRSTKSDFFHMYLMGGEL